MLKLYELPYAYEQIYRLLAETEGEITPDLLAELHTLDTNLEAKAANVCSLIRQAEAEMEMLKMQIARLQLLAGKRDQMRDRLKAYLLGVMEQLGIQKIDTGRPGLSPRIQRNSRPTISLRAGENVPLAYQRIKVELDGQKAYEHWKEGRKLPEVLEVREGHHLRIG